METRVKARLIGALILVALIVLLVPEMLSGPRQGQKSSAGGGAAQTYTIDLSAPTARVAPTATATESPPPAPPPAAPDDVPTETVHVESTSQPEASQPTEEPTPGRIESPPSGSADSGDESAWVVQLGSFASEDNAERLAGQLKSRGYKAFVSRSGSGTRTRFRVRVGPEQERARAENLAERLRRDGRQAVVLPNS
jgi:DedD protein